MSDYTIVDLGDSENVAPGAGMPDVFGATIEERKENDAELMPGWCGE